ncbi:MAG: aspartate aminotransferase family protein [Gemmatimonadetes bacterium]|nr:MAG: aspartate aminotransferase family protein [Gemmatimonadota bacterium]
MNDWRVPGFTSTGSKRPDALFGTPARMTRAAGCRVWDESGREYVDFVMALGAVALGYGHADVNRAATAAIAAGVVGPLPPVAEAELAEALAERIPWLERVRFLKTGAEAVAAAVRLARVATAREEILGCGYHGWLDWCQGAAEGVPAGVRNLFAELPFNDVAAGRELIRARAPRLAAVVVEPVVVSEPTREWLQMLRVETERAGAILIFDEIKTAFRLAIGGAAERYTLKPAPDLVVLGKALANGFPLAVVGGRADLMNAANRTWISSTLATEGVALAAARATLEVFERDGVCEHIHRIGTRLLPGSPASPRCVSCITRRRICRGVWRCAPLSAASCSSARPTTSCPWRTTRARWTVPSPCCMRPCARFRRACTYSRAGRPRSLR